MHLLHVFMVPNRQRKECFLHHCGVRKRRSKSTDIMLILLALVDFED